MKQLFLIDTDTHVIVPREPAILQLKSLDATRTLLTDRQVYRAIINTAPYIEPVTCETCANDSCTRQVFKPHIDPEHIGLVFTRIDGCDQWEPKK